MKKKFLVIGLGDLGSKVATELHSKGADVIAIDKDAHITDSIKNSVTTAMTMDSTDVTDLRTLGIEASDSVIITIGPDDFESTILTSVVMLELGVQKILARANSEMQAKILRKLGVHQVVIPDEQIARQMISLASHQDIMSSIFLGEDYSIVYLKVPKAFIGKSLQELELRIRYNINLITLKRIIREVDPKTGEENEVEKIYGVPAATTTLQKDDVLIVLGKDKDIKKIID